MSVKHALCIGGPMDGQWVMLDQGMVDFKFQGATISSVSHPEKKVTTVFGYTLQEIWGGEKKFWLLLAEGLSLGTSVQLLVENYRPVKLPVSDPPFPTLWDTMIHMVKQAFTSSWFKVDAPKAQRLNDLETVVERLIDWSEEIEKA